MLGRCAKMAVNFILVLFLFFGFSVLHGQEEQADESKQLREEILKVYQSKGEQGLQDFVKKKRNRISNKFIVDFAEAGVNERKEEWLKVCEIMAKERKDEKTFADILYYTGEYFRLISDNKKSADFFNKALFIYQKLNDIVGQGDIFMGKGDIYFYTGDNSRALEMYNRALFFFKKAEVPIGLGDVYQAKGEIYYFTGNNLKALEMYDKALPFYEKTKYIRGIGNVLKGKGDVFLDTGDNYRALEMYDEAFSFYEKAGDTLGQGNVNVGKAGVYSNMGENSKALEMYDKALPFFEKVSDPHGQGNVYKGKAGVCMNMGENSRALDMYDKAFPFFEKAGEPIGEGMIFLGKGSVYLNMGDNSRALEMYDKAMPFFEKAEYPIAQGDIYKCRGDIHLIIGDNLKTFEMYSKALSFYEKAGYTIGLGNIYERKGEIFTIIGDNYRAFEMYNKALSFYEKVGYPIGQGDVYMGKGIVYLIIGDNSRAIDMYDKALPFFEKASYPLGLGNIYDSKGYIYFDTGNNSRAFEMYDKALIFFKKAGNLVGHGNVHMGMGDIYFDTGNNARAIEMYDKAYHFFNKGGDIELESNSLHAKAKVLVKLRKKIDALRLFEKGISFLEKIRIQTACSEMKMFFMETVYTQYKETVLFMLENKYYQKGFQYAESMKSRVFLDRMKEELVPLEKGLKPDLKEKRDKLVAKLSSLSKQMHEAAGGKDEKKLKELKEQYGKTEDEFDELLIKIRLENPLYSSVRYPQPIPVQELQKEILKKDEILVRYFISPDKLYVFLVSQDSFKVIPLEINQKRLNWTVETYRFALIENNASHIRRYGKILYEKIFKPLEPVIKKSKNVIIIPDGQLATIPFESFIIDKKEPGEPLFLLEKYRLMYIQSASILSVLRKNYRRDIETNGFIGFGDPVYDYKNFSLGKREKGASSRNDKTKDEIKEIHRDRYTKKGGILNRLEPSGEEVEEIARLFREKSQEGKILLRQHASEENAKMLYLKDFDYIHFSCHGLLNDDFQSLVLSQDIPGAKEDGYFTLNEIMNCDYNAKLVVLSACRTGSGKMQGGEGVTGMTRAVMYAGTPSVVASLWEVDATATKELMVKFYENILEKNLDKSEALRQAKLELINNKKYRSPLFWSAFVLYGE